MKHRLVWINSLCKTSKTCLNYYCVLCLLFLVAARFCSIIDPTFTTVWFFHLLTFPKNEPLKGSLNSVFPLNVSCRPCCQDNAFYWRKNKKQLLEKNNQKDVQTSLVHIEYLWTHMFIQYVAPTVATPLTAYIQQTLPIS